MIQFSPEFIKATKDLSEYLNIHELNFIEGTDFNPNRRCYIIENKNTDIIQIDITTDAVYNLIDQDGNTKKFKDQNIAKAIVQAHKHAQNKNIYDIIFVISDLLDTNKITSVRYNIMDNGSLFIVNKFNRTICKIFNLNSNPLALYPREIDDYIKPINLKSLKYSILKYDVDKKVEGAA